MRRNSAAAELYIFVTAPRADPYVNVLMYLLRNRAIAGIHYIAVVEHGYTNEQMEARLSDIEANVGILLDQLGEGFYGSREIEIDLAWRDAYRECRRNLDRIRVERLTISWSDLDTELGRFLEADAVIFDITTLKKNLLVDVVALLLSRGRTEIFSFEQVTAGQPRYDDKGLIHALSPNGYYYRSVAQSKLVEKARARFVAKAITFRTALVVTAVVGLVVIIIQVFFANKALESIILAIATVAAIASWLYTFVRDDG
jgi:hypothetical protein